MFTDEPVEYLTSFKQFLLEQQSKKDDDSTIAALLAQIDRELVKRTELAPSRQSPNTKRVEPV